MLSKIRNARGFTLIELMIVVAIIAILSVVAVPAFIKYMRKAKSSEAVDMLDKIYKGGATYYAEPRVQENTGSKLDCQFPASQSLTPVEGSCCASGGGPDANNDDRCDKDPDAWTTPTWSALKFQITEEHYFVLSFNQNDLTEADAQFTANAHADLDCDETWSTFQRYGKGDPKATKGECAIVSAAALFSNNETE
jgi:prepilin-type N-terminal cleavage/methylation domain-containing protein